MSNIPLIKEKLDLVAYIGEVTRLQKRGRTFSGLCPFHDEKTPSFYVWPHTQTFKCFGCGKHGSVIDFYAYLHEMTVAEAVKALEEELQLSPSFENNTSFSPLKSEDFERLGLMGSHMKTLYQEDREAYFFILEGKINERLDVYQDMLSKLPDGDVKRACEKQRQSFKLLWKKGIQKDKYQHRREVFVC